MGAVLGEVARRLATGDAEEVEILPVERARDRRAGEDDRASEHVTVDQRHDDPRGGQRGEGVGDAVVFRLIERDDAAPRQAGEQCRVVQVGRVGPVPGRGGDERAFVRVEQEAGGRIGEVGDRADDARAERLGPGRAQRGGEALPLDAVVVAVAEEVLGELHPRPGAQPGGGGERQQRGGAAEHHRGLGDAPVDAERRARLLGDERERGGVGEHREDADAADDDGTRQRGRVVMAVLDRRGDEERDPGEHGAAQRRDRLRRGGREEGDDEEQELRPPQGGERDEEQPRGTARGEDELVDEEQPSHRAEHAERVPGLGERGALRGLGGGDDAGGGEHDREREVERRRLPRDAERTRDADRDDEPGEVADDADDARRDVQPAEPRDAQRPEGGQPQRRRYRAARPPRRRVAPRRQRERAEQQRRERMRPEDERSRHAALTARRPARARRAASAAGSGGRGRANSSWRSRGRIQACGAHPRSTRHRGS